MPSQRAKADTERVAARQAQMARNPGPGAYQPKRAPRTAEELAGSTAFKSKSERKPDEMLKDAGDPGLYNPYEGGGIGSQSVRSFNKSQQSGAGNFGTRTKRAELSVPNDAPGTGTYDAKEPAKPEAKQGSAFASQTKRGAYTRKEVTPGAGEYEPKGPGESRVEGGDSMFKNKDMRFKKSAEIESQAHVGPGSYSQEQMTIKSDYQKHIGHVSYAFASTTLREGFTG